MLYRPRYPLQEQYPVLQKNRDQYDHIVDSSKTRVSHVSSSKNNFEIYVGDTVQYVSKGYGGVTHLGTWGFLRAHSCPKLLFPS